MKHQKTAYILNKGKLIFLLTVFFALVMVGGMIVNAADCRTYNEPRKVYTAIEIKSGDTLWEIAGNYAPDGMTTKEYILELMELNQLVNSNITCGQNLIVFYYE